MSDSVSSVSSSNSNAKLSTANQQALGSSSVPNPQYFQLLVDQFMNNTISTLAKSDSNGSSSGSSLDLNSFLNSNSTNNSSSSTSSTGTNTATAANTMLSSQNQQALGSTAYNAASYQLLGQQFMNSAISNLAKIGISDDDDDDDSSSSSPDLNSIMGLNNSSSSSTSSTTDLSAQINKLQSLNTYANLVDPENPSTATYIDPTTGKDGSGVIEAIKTDKNGTVIFTINGIQVPLSYVQGLTRA